MRCHERGRHRGRSAGGRAGFTLPEVLVALLVTALLAGSARQVVDELGSAGRRMIAGATDADRDANAERMLRALLGSYEAGRDEAPPFDGAARAVRFPTWCQSAAGWVERCLVTLTIERSGEEAALFADVATAGGRQRLRLAPVPADAVFAYLQDAEGGGTWTPAWREGAEAPLGVRVPFGPEVLLVRIGVSG